MGHRNIRILQNIDPKRENPFDRARKGGPHKQSLLYIQKTAYKLCRDASLLSYQASINKRLLNMPLETGVPAWGPRSHLAVLFNSFIHSHASTMHPNNAPHQTSVSISFSFSPCLKKPLTFALRPPSLSDRWSASRAMRHCMTPRCLRWSCLWWSR